MGVFQRIIIGLCLILTVIVMGELYMLYRLDTKTKAPSSAQKVKSTIKAQDVKPTVLVPIQEKTIEQSNSCSNWYAKYTHIESTQTITRGIFSHIEVNDRTKETKIHLESGKSQYYVLFENDITKVAVSDANGKKISLSLLKKGSPLKITEQYEKLANNKESFSITVITEKP